VRVRRLLEPGGVLDAAGGALGVDVDEDDGLPLLDQRVDGPLERVLAVLVLVDAHGHQRVAEVRRPGVPAAVNVRPPHLSTAAYGV
jgi:hypothetical protein